MKSPIIKLAENGTHPDQRIFKNAPEFNERPEYKILDELQSTEIVMELNGEMENFQLFYGIDEEIIFIYIYRDLYKNCKGLEVLQDITDLVSPTLWQTLQEELDQAMQDSLDFRMEV